MKRVIASGLSLAVMLALAVAPQGGSVVSASDNLTKTECEAQGGTWVNDSGTKSCDLTFRPSGNSGEGWTEESSQQGTIGNQGTDETFTSTCANPGGHEQTTGQCA